MTGRILSGGKSDFERIERGIGEVLFERADLYSDDVLQVEALSGRTETFASVKLRATRLAVSLQKLGITSGDIIVTCLRMNMDTIVPHLAALYLGAIFAGIDPIQTECDWRHCIGIVKPRLIFVEEGLVERLEKCLDASETKPEVIVHGKSSIYRTFDELVQPCSEEKSFRPKSIENSGDTAVIMFSSGTTGSPKPMTLSHFSLLNQILLFIEIFGSEDFKVELIFSSYYWITSIIILIRCFFSGGCRLISSKFHPEETLRAMERYKVTCCFIPPAISQRLVKVENAKDYDLSSVKLFFSGGTGISSEHYYRLRKLFQDGVVLNLYGSTEAGGMITAYDLDTDYEYARHHPRTVGKVVKDAEIKIIDEETRALLGPNQLGEIWIRSMYAMNGYHNNFATLKQDSDGFFQSGDIGYYDDNDFIYLSGRSNDMFKYGTLKVAPEVWEAVLRKHPSIHDAAVLGIPHESDGWLPAACLVLERDATVTKEEIENFFVKEMTERHRFAGGIRFLKELPKTPSGKLLRRELRNFFNEAIC